jgi:SSS family solute:Na+ symporter
MVSDGSLNPDRAYPTLLNLLPVGLKGLSFAALTAAVVASLAGKANSIATIFTLDIYKKKIRPAADEKQIVNIGKLTVVVAMLIAILVAPLLGIDKKGGFQYIQEYTGFVSPGVFAMFIMGFFWRRATSSAAMFALIGGFLGSLLLKFLPTICDLSFLASIGLSKANESGVFEIPFLDRMGLVFAMCIVGMIAISYLGNSRNDQKQSLEIDTRLFKVSNGFAVGTLIVLGILVALYGLLW